MFDSMSEVENTSLPRCFGRSEASLSPDVKRSFPPDAKRSFLPRHERSEASPSVISSGAKRSREIFSSNEEAVESYPERMKGNEHLCF